jgi:hypothetical protein
MGDNHSFVVVLTAGRIATLRKIAMQQGIIATQHGEIDAHGVKLGYSINDDYHPKDGSTEVAFTVLHKPLFVTEGLVEEKIHEYLDQLPEAPEVETPHVVVGQESVPLTQDGFSEDADAPPLKSEQVGDDSGGAEGGDSGAELAETGDEPPVTEEPNPGDELPVAVMGTEDLTDQEIEESTPAAPVTSKRVSKKK